jgi:hypothetical protein
MRIPHRGLLWWTAGLITTVFVRLAVNPAVLGYHPRCSLAIWNWYLYTYLVPALAFFLAAWLLTRGDDRLGGQGDSPVRVGHFPREQGVFPSGEGHFPRGQGVLPDGQGHFPRGKGCFPDGEGHSPRANDDISRGKGDFPDAPGGDRVQPGAAYGDVPALR